MSGQRHALWIGLFVLGALTIAVAFLFLLGGGALFEQRLLFVAYFDESVKGLRPGAPVDFRGVPVGTVREVRAEYDGATGGVRVPVVLEIDPEAIRSTGGAPVDEAWFAQRIEEGLRAQLQLESLLTGQLYVALDVVPQPPPPRWHPDAPYPEIPTRLSQLSRLKEGLDAVTVSLPLLLDQAREVLDRLRLLLSDANRSRFERLLARSAGAAERLEEAAAQLPPLIREARGAAEQVRRLAQELRATAADRSRDLEESLQSVTQAARQFARTAAAVERLVAEVAPNVEDFAETGLPLFVGLIEDASRMVAELQGLVRDVRNDPARFLFGDRFGEGVEP